MRDELEFIVEEISRKSGRSKEEIWDMVRKYVAEYDGILKEDGAVYLVAYDLGVKLEQKAEKIKEPEIIPLEKAVPGMRRAIIRGRIIRMIGVMPYTSKDGENAERAEFFISDGKKTARVVVWNKSTIERIKKKEIKEGDVVMISRARVGRRGEDIAINVDSESEVNVLEGEFPEYPIPSTRILTVSEVLSEELLPEVDVRGILSGMFQPTEFSRKDGGTGRKASFSLRDEKTGDEVRVVFWDEKVDLLSGIPVNSLVILKNMRIKERNDSVELHSTALTEVSVEGPQRDNFLKGEIVYLSKIRDIISRSGSRKMLYFIIKKNGELIPGRAWNDAADILSRMGIPCLVEIRGISMTKLGDRDFLSIDGSSDIKVVESRAGRGPPIDYIIAAKNIIYTKTSISEATGGLVEIRGIVSYVGDIFIRWYCEKCGGRAEREYGKLVCRNCGDTTGIPRPSLTIFVDDGTGIAKAILAGKDVEQIVKKSVGEMLEEIDMKGLEMDRYSPDDLRNKLSGEEVVIRGSARMGSDGILRIIVEDIETPKVEYEISFLSSKVRNMIAELLEEGDKVDQSSGGEQRA
ncbi:MAG: hypothetical protein ACP5LQ_00810 [Candidatus Methanodesulfokora sp.]